MLHKRKLITSLLLITALVFSCTGAVFADTAPQASAQAAGDITPQYAAYITIGTDRVSGTCGDTVIDVTFSGIASSYSITATLQEKYNGSWRTATGVSWTTDSTSGKNTGGAMLVSTWDLQSSKAYRIKYYVKDVVSGVTYTGTYYSDSF